MMVNVAVVLKRTRSRSTRPAVAPRTSPHLTLASRGSANIHRVFGSDLKERSGATYSALALAFKHYMRSRRLKKKSSIVCHAPIQFHHGGGRFCPCICVFWSECVKLMLNQNHMLGHCCQVFCLVFSFGTHTLGLDVVVVHKKVAILPFWWVLCVLFSIVSSLEMSKRNVPKRIIPLNS